MFDPTATSVGWWRTVASMQGESRAWRGDALPGFVHGGSAAGFERRCCFASSEARSSRRCLPVALLLVDCNGLAKLRREREVGTQLAVNEPIVFSALREATDECLLESR
jgi:hypothetical protein